MNVTQQRTRDYIVKVKTDKSCADCGVDYPYYVMDFDHPNDDRNGRPCLGVKSYQSSLSKLKDEIDSCDVVCANCHRERSQVRMLKHSLKHS